MRDFDSEIAAIKSRINTAQTAKIRAETLRDTAEENYAAAMKRLQEEFGLDNLDEARAKLGQLQTSLQEKMDEVTHMLDSIQASKKIF